MDWLLEFVSREDVAAMVLAGVGALFAAAWRWKKVKEWKLERALQCLEAGVRSTYENYVRLVKPDGGQLTPEQRREAMRQTLAAAADNAIREGVDLAKYYAREYLPVVVEKIIRRTRREAAGPFDEA